MKQRPEWYKTLQEFSQTNSNKYTNEFTKRNQTIPLRAKHKTPFHSTIFNKLTSINR